MSSFLERLKLLSAGRTFNAWFKQIGWAPGDITRINQGGLPGAEKLSLLATIENVSLTWLLTGEGTPYVVRYCVTKVQAAGVIAELEGTDSSWTRYWFKLDGGGMVVIWTRHKAHPANQSLSWAETQVLVAIGPTSFEQLAYLRGEEMTEQISALERSQIAEGWLGPFQMQALGIRPAPGAPSVRESPVSDSRGQYLLLRNELLQEFAQLKTEDLQLLRDLVRRIIK